MTLAEQRSGSSSWRVAAAARFEREVLRAFDGAVTLSEIDARTLRSLLPLHSIATVPSGTDIVDVPEFVETGAAPVIAFVGYFKHAPNVDAAQWLANDIMPLVRQHIPNALLRLVGRNAPAAVAELERPGMVEVPGYVEDMVAELSRATVVALPLRTGGGLRGKLLEAWAAGRPVVATPIACEGLDPEGGVHCLIAVETQQFADSLVAALKDPVLRLHLGASGRLLARQRYSVDAAIDAFDVVYDEMLYGGRP